jgi:hypothetical protein
MKLGVPAYADRALALSNSTRAAQPMSGRMQGFQARRTALGANSFVSFIATPRIAV